MMKDNATCETVVQIRFAKGVEAGILRAGLEAQGMGDRPFNFEGGAFERTLNLRQHINGPVPTGNAFRYCSGRFSNHVPIFLFRNKDM
jgi:hypothetical protein